MTLWAKFSAWAEKRQKQRDEYEFAKGYGFVMYRFFHKEETLEYIEKHVDAMDDWTEPYSHWQAGANAAIKTLHEWVNRIGFKIK